MKSRTVSLYHLHEIQNCLTVSSLLNPDLSHCIIFTKSRTVSLYHLHKIQNCLTVSSWIRACLIKSFRLKLFKRCTNIIFYKHTSVWSNLSGADEAISDQSATWFMTVYWGLIYNQWMMPRSKTSQLSATLTSQQLPKKTSFNSPWKKQHLKTSVGKLSSTTLPLSLSLSLSLSRFCIKGAVRDFHSFAKFNNTPSKPHPLPLTSRFLFIF